MDVNLLEAGGRTETKERSVVLYDERHDGLRASIVRIYPDCFPLVDDFWILRILEDESN